ncbi:chromophore lyase CpcT/CpeT [Capilliphycus salinus ALCB114379]|uniref:chromophore lyase CpcT/CpeT n=1 Tax=Capilliphycus salinus TaxID=2768948 RepID=UPI0039A462C6
MNFSPELMALARYLAGEFDNQAQAMAEPAWYVHLHLWQRPLPIPLFKDSITLFVEQANALTPDQPYRQRMMQLYSSAETTERLHVQYYMLKDLKAVQGGGRHAEKLRQLTPEQLEFLPGCRLDVTCEPLTANTYHFKANLPENTRCCFTYQNQTLQIDLGFEAMANEFLSYDKGINPQTGQATWGALLGPFRFVKRIDFASELSI